MSIQYPKLILPKPHLSWSQVSIWMTNRERYKREYFEAGKKLDTKYLRFGGKFSRMVEELGEIMKRIPNRATAIEELAREYPMSESMRIVLMDLNIDGVSEYQIGNTGNPEDTTPICRVRHIVPVLAFLDKYRENENGLGEYKTGLVPWTKAKVQKHDQLPFYGVALKWSGKPLPFHADLDWIETIETKEESVDFWREGEKILDVTGRIMTFRREFDEREFERMEDLIVRVAWEISDAYQEHLSNL